MRSKVEMASSLNCSGAVARSTSVRIAARALTLSCAPSARTAARCTVELVSAFITDSSVATTSSPDTRARNPIASARTEGEGSFFATSASFALALGSPLVPIIITALLRSDTEHSSRRWSTLSSSGAAASGSLRISVLSADDRTEISSVSQVLVPASAAARTRVAAELSPRATNAPLTRVASTSASSALLARGKRLLRASSAASASRSSVTPPIR